MKNILRHKIELLGKSIIGSKIFVDYPDGNGGELLIDFNRVPTELFEEEDSLPPSFQYYSHDDLEFVSFYFSFKTLQRNLNTIQKEKEFLEIIEQKILEVI